MKKKHQPSPEWRSKLVPVQTRQQIDAETAKMQHTPSEAQIESGDYVKSYLLLHGLPIAIENPKGTIRSGKSENGQETWHTMMPCDYGDFLDTLGKDGDPVDVMIGPHPELPSGFVVNQNDQEGNFDEHKVLLGWGDADAAKAGYLSCYAEGWSGFGSMAAITLPDLTTWLQSGDHSQPYAPGPNRPPSQKANDAMNVCPKCGGEITDTSGGLVCPKCGASLVEGDPQAGAMTGQAPGSAVGLMDGVTAGEKSTLENGQTFTDSINGGEVLVDSADEFVILASDAVNKSNLRPGELMKVKQLATITDARNLNERLYPASVVRDAVERPGGVRERMRAGVMLSERVHPDAVTVKGRDVYVDNPSRKTGRVDDIDFKPNGKVYIHRTILDTEHGRKVAAAFQAKKPEGISTRFMMSGHMTKVDNLETLVADWMDISTWDDVETPAVPQTSQDYVLLTDSQLVGIGLAPQATHDDTTTNDRNANDPITQEVITNTMNPKVRKALNDLRSAINKRAPKAEVDVLRRLAADAIEKWNKDDENADIGPASDALSAADVSMMSLPGYNSDRPNPTITSPEQISGPNVNEFAPDQNEAGQPANQPTQENQMVPPIRTRESGTLHNDEAIAAAVTAGLAGMGLDQAALDYLKDKREADAKVAADAQKSTEIGAACDAAFATDAFTKLPADVQESIKGMVRATATDAASVPTLVDLHVEQMGKLLADATLRGRGFGGGGQTTQDPASPEHQEARALVPFQNAGRGYQGAAVVTREARPYMAHVDHLLAATDDYRRTTSGFNAQSSEVRKLRAANMANFIEPMLDELAMREHSAKNAQEWFNASDSLYKKGERALADSLGVAASDTVTTTTLFSQPTILSAFLIQQFQDCEMLQFAQGIGPGLNDGSGGWELTGNAGDGKIGSILRIPVELYNAPGGYGTDGGTQYDAFLQTPEGLGIDEASITTVFLPFAPTWKRIAISLTRDVIKALGNGPLNYPAVARSLYHIAADKGRRIDKAIGNEFVQISDDYGAVVISGETESLTNNSVYSATAGNIVVNLNSAKTAAATVTATDQAVVYGTPGATSNVVAALRLLAGATGTSAPYFGTAFGATPICRPRLKTDMDNQGNYLFTTLNGFSPGTLVSPTAGAYLGYLDAFGNIKPIAGGNAAPNYAVDYNNGTVIFTAAYPALTGSGGLITAGPTTFSYSYVTNFDNFVVNNPTLGNLSPAAYYDGLLAQFDRTAARMGSAPRYVKPNLALMSLNAATWLTQADIFYKLNSPDGSSLYPTESFFIERNGVMGARHNCPWQVGDTRIQLTRMGSTKYALDTPFEIRGPYPATDSNQRIIPKEIYYGEENSLICTPQVIDSSGNIKNPVARAILLR